LRVLPEGSNLLTKPRWLTVVTEPSAFVSG
jgi:hypothetical protein